MYSQDVKSLNTSYTTEDGQEYELLDTIESDLRLEESVIDDLYGEHCKSELWGIVACYTSEREADVLRDRFKNKKTIRAISEKQNISFQRVREIEQNALIWLWWGRIVPALIILKPRGKVQPKEQR